MRLLNSFNRRLGQLELALACGLGLAITLLIMLNIVTRSIGQAVYWVDEAAIAAMVWMGLLGASVALSNRSSIAVTILPDMLSQKPRYVLTLLVDVCVLVFAAIMLVLVWQWFDPVGLARAGFDTRAFAAETFNFIYTETTTTLVVRKFWLWLIMPVFSVCILIHGLTNLVESLQEGVRLLKGKPA